jgi:outer membrane protein assembly factor BamD (BamD/ComL family)
MNKRLKTVILFFILTIFSVYGKEVNFSNSVENYKIGYKIKFSEFEKNESVECFIEERPFLSESEPFIKDGYVIIEPDTVGKYEVKIESKGTVLRYSFKIEGEQSAKADELFKIIKQKISEESYRDAIDRVILLKQNFPESRYFPDALYLAADAAEKNGENKTAIKFLKKITDNFKLSEEANEMVIYKLFKAFEKAEDKEAAHTYGKMIYKLNSEKYFKEYGKFCIKHTIYEREGIDIIEDYYSKTLDKESAEIIGDFYLETNPEKAAVFYKNDNNKKLSLAYLRLKDYNKFQTVYATLTADEKKEVSKVVEEQKKREVLESYFKKIEDGNSQKKYQISEIYANKILTESKNEKMKKDALFALGEIAYLKKDFKKTIDYLKKYENNYGIIREVDIYHYLALSYYNLNDLKNSYIYFDKITKEFPFTSWDSKAKIYKMKLKM